MIIYKTIKKILGKTNVYEINDHLKNKKLTLMRSMIINNSIVKIFSAREILLNKNNDHLKNNIRIFFLKKV